VKAPDRSRTRLNGYPRFDLRGTSFQVGSTDAVSSSLTPLTGIEKIDAVDDSVIDSRSRLRLLDLSRSFQQSTSSRVGTSSAR
jgi:hypothetical protein